MLNENTLVKVTASEDRISFRTVSRSYKSPPRFVILRSALKRLADESCMVSDLSSFASLWHVQGTNDLHICFSWLSDHNGTLSGRKELIRLPFCETMRFLHDSISPDGPKERAFLSFGRLADPWLHFDAPNNLKNVLAVPLLRRRLVRFLRDHFHWRNGGEVRFFDDCDPFSFTFREYLPGRTGLCGGVVLHREEDLKNAYYSLHT